MNQVYEDVEEHIPYLHRYAQSLTHNPVAADDLVQDSLARALSKSHLFKSGTNLRAWLFTILRNRYISDMRRQARTGIAIDPDDVAQVLATRPNQESHLITKALERMLTALPPSQRTLLELVSLDGMSYENAAELFDVPVGTVKSRISRSRHALRARLDGEKPAANGARGALKGAPGTVSARPAPWQL